MKKFEGGFNLILDDEGVLTPMPATNYDFRTMDSGIATVVEETDGWRIIPNENNRYGEVSMLVEQKSFSEYSGIFKLGVKQTEKLIIPMVSAGTDHILTLKSDGTVWAWGKNDKGQLGNGDTNDTEYPAKVSFPHNSDGSEVKFMAVAAGNKFSVALSTTGEVYTWGWNEYGQLGDGNWNEYHEEIISTEDVWGNCCWPTDTPLDSQRYRDHKHIKYKRVQDNNNVLSPQKINLKDIVAISAATGVNSNLDKDDEKLDLLNDNTSGGHTLALDKNGNVWAWGLNNKGQIGTNTDVKFEQIQLGFTTNGYTNDEGVVEGDSEWHKEYDAETCYTYIPSQENLYITEPTKVVGLEGIGYLNSISEISAGGNSSIAVRKRRIRICLG